MMDFYCRSEEPQNFCKICNKRVRSLQNHLANVHSGVVKVKENEVVKALCSYCGKRFKYESHY